VIPVSASLRRHGASRGATTAFLISTPQTGIDSIMVTLSLLGPVFAIFRPFAAFVAGVVGGGIVDAVERGSDEADDPPPRCEDACCSGEGHESKVLAALRYGFVTLPRDIGRSLLVGLLLAGLISALVKPEHAAAVGTGFVGMVVMMLLGLPIYVCATASVPIAFALITKGVSPGAAFVFLMTGPATNAASITTIWKVMGRRTAVVYLVTVGLSALALGALLDLIYVHARPEHIEHVHGLLPPAVKTASAVVLLLLLAAAIVWRPRAEAHAKSDADRDETVTLTIEGMTCSHCVASVARALGEVEGVASADVDLDSGRAVVTGRGLDRQALRAAVEALCYAVTAPPGGPPSPGESPQ
jgi:uncharacterized membrane protein YraQ (UPF0718 family)/copper chaperone CopZ